MPYPQTRLEQLAQQSRLTVAGFRERYAATARRLAEAGQGRPATVSDRQVRRWFAGRLDGLPHLSACRVLDQMFGEPAEALFGPPSPAPATVDTRPGPRQHTDPAGSLAVDREVAMAASDSARFGQFAEQNNVGPHTLEQFRADIERIATNYGNRPVYPTFVEVHALRDRAFELLEGRQRPDQTRDLYLVAGLLCAILGEASHDLGNTPAAKTQFRTAFLCGELAGNNWLRAWVRGMQSVIAYWDGQPRISAELAADGWQYKPEAGTARVRLACLEGRARAKLHDERATNESFARADQARELVNSEDDPGGQFVFSPAVQHYYGSTAQLWLGGQTNYTEAGRLAAVAVDLLEADPPEQRQLGYLCTARVDLAFARLGHDDLEGAAAEIDQALAIATQRRSEPSIRRLQQFSNTLERPRHQATSLALDLRDQIRMATTTPALPAGST